MQDAPTLPQAKRTPPFAGAGEQWAVDACRAACRIFGAREATADHLDDCASRDGRECDCF